MKTKLLPFQLAFLSLLALFAVTAPARASGLTVTSPADDGSPGTLRAAIGAAHPGDTLFFDNRLSGQTITVTGGPLTIGKNLTIIGPGSGQLAINASLVNSAFSVSSGVTVTIESLTISNGKTDAGLYNNGTLTLNHVAFSGNVGVGLFNDLYGVLVVRDCAFTGNTGIVGNGNGAAIFNRQGALTVRESTFSNNSIQASGGGVIYGGAICSVGGTVLVDSCTFTGNSASATYGEGGAIANVLYGVMTVSRSTFTGNAVLGSQATGGGIYNRSLLTVNNCTFNGNSAQSGGGGIFNDGGTVNIKNSIIANSSGGDYGFNYNPALNCQGVNFSDDNTCPGFTQVTSPALNLGPLGDNGGPTMTCALLAGSVAIDAAADCTDWSGNSLATDQRGVARPQGATCDAGAFEVSIPNNPPVARTQNVVVAADASCSATVSIDDGSFDPDAGDSIMLSQSPPGPYGLGQTLVTLTATDNHGASSQAQATVLVVITPTSCTGVSTPGGIVTSSADDGGVGTLRVALLGAVPGETITFANNLVGQTITLTSGPLAINQNLILSGLGPDQLAVSGNQTGPVFFVPPGVIAVIENVTIRDGFTTAGYDGAGIWNAGALTLRNVALSGNSSSQSGGGIYNGTAGTLTVADSAVSGNSGLGAGIYNAGTLNVSNSIFTTNSSAVSGAGIYNSGAITAINSTFSGNSTGNAGGGIFNDTRSTLTVSNCTFSGNYGGLYGGGAIYNGGGLAVFCNSTFSGNNTDGNSGLGAGIFNDLGGTITISSTTLAANSASFSGGLLNLWGTMNIKNSIVANNPGGDGYNGDTVNPAGANFDTDGSFSSSLAHFTSATPAQLNLGPLADNGGPTQTSALLACSVAIDAATDGTDWFGNPVLTDQRGVARPQGAAGDAGAYEFVNSPPVARCQNRIVSAGGNCSADASIDNGSYDPDACDTIILSQSPAGPYPLGTTVVTLTVTDNHGASSQAQATVTVKDTQPPIVSCPANVTVITTNANGMSVKYPAAMATDTCSTPTLAYSKATGSLFALGTTPVTVTATDAAGNTASCSFNVSVVYSWSGFLSPLNPNGSSVFKLGATVPVKFQLTGASGAIANAVAKLTCVKVGDTAGTVNQPVSTSSSDSGNTFRYDATNKQYVFNWGTKGLTSGAYQLTVNLGDGISRTVNLGLK